MFNLKYDRYCISATRFNDDTWEENERFREKMNIKGCIYGVPRKIATTIPDGSIMFVFEMNNSKPSQIMGLGIIRNVYNKDKRFNIYFNENYNRFSYFSKYRLDREYLQEHYPEILNTTENIVFKGKDHSKRGSGITLLPSKKIKPHRKIYKEFIKNIAKNILFKE